MKLRWVRYRGAINGFCHSWGGWYLYNSNGDYAKCLEIREIVVATLTHPGGK